ncbi:hypothetical protein MRB53_031369 [Persea americana]|uniref:Uncharacterized protein n=1 Tax=Persea americana TaxID=3435 RepID=A0ACC2KP83_PERAE|nr:hypothetical protein MRB53_031369 [Persea americana]
MAAPAIPTHPTSLPLFPSIFFIIITFFFFLPSLCQSSDSPYDTCTPFACGNIRNITFPFSSSSSSTTSDLLSCGLPEYKISCDPSSQASITLSGRPYQLKSLSPEKIMVVSDLLLFNNLATSDCKSIQNLSLPESQIAPLTVPQWGTYLNFYRCPLVPEIPLGNFAQQVQIYTECKDDVRLYLVRTIAKEVPIAPSGCLYFKVPVLLTSLIAYNLSLPSSSSSSLIKEMNWTVLMDVLGKGFLLQWPDVGVCSNCTGMGGRCGFKRDSGSSNTSSGRVECLYREAGTGSKSSRKRQIIIGTTVTSAFVVLVIVAFLTFKFRHKATSILNKDYFKSKRSKENDRNMGEFIKNYRSTLVAKYSYSDIHKMTNGFKDKLGEGGYGNVFKEMVGGKKSVKIKEEYSSSTYFPNWMYNQLEQDSDLEIIDSIVEEDSAIVKKMVMVGLWCVQLNPSDRPAMSRVAEMLTGSVEGIEMPPKPFLFSPPRSQAGDVVTVTESYSNDTPLMFDST